MVRSMEVNFSLLCRDIEAQMSFYQALFGWSEERALRTQIFRALKPANMLFGFHAPAARGLLSVGADAILASQAGGFPTIHLPDVQGVGDVAAKAVRLHGSLVKAPFATYYGQWQTVLRDPEGNLLRVACLALPPGVEAPLLELPRGS